MGQVQHVGAIDHGLRRVLNGDRDRLGIEVRPEGVPARRESFLQECSRSTTGIQQATRGFTGQPDHRSGHDRAQRSLPLGGPTTTVLTHPLVGQSQPGHEGSPLVFQNPELQLAGSATRQRGR